MDYFSTCFPVEIFSQIALMISYDELRMLFKCYTGITRKFDNETFWKIMYYFDINSNTQSYRFTDPTEKSKPEKDCSFRITYNRVIQSKNMCLRNKCYNEGVGVMASYGAKRHMCQFLDLGAFRVDFLAFELAIWSEDIPLIQRLRTLHHDGMDIVAGARHALIRSRGDHRSQDEQRNDLESKLNIIMMILPESDYTRSRADVPPVGGTVDRTPEELGPSACRCQRLYKQEFLNGTLRHASKLGYMNIMTKMVELGATDVNGALESAVTGGQTDSIKYLMSKGAIIYESVFNAACEHNQRESINVLISLGVNNFQGGAIVAAQKGHLDLVEYLIQRSQYTKTIEYETLMGPCLDSILDGKNEAVKEKIQLVVDMLIKNGATNYSSEYIAATERKKKKDRRSYYSCYVREDVY